MNCLVKEGIYSAPLILLAIRRSLKGIAAGSLAYLLPFLFITFSKCLISCLALWSLQNNLLRSFIYAAKQKESETAGSWACRLQQLMSRVTNTGELTVSMGCSMLREIFSIGLCLEKIKTLTRHKFDSGASWTDLLVAVRVVEHEAKLEGKPTTNKGHSSQWQVSDSVEGKLEQIIWVVVSRS